MNAPLRVRVIDNHDSFVHTLVGYLRELGAAVAVTPSDAIGVEDLDAARDDLDALLISPGPGTPAGAGVSVPAVRWAASRGVPLLGVCLGHEAIGEAFGARVAEAPELMHGMVSRVTHDGSPLYAGLPSPFAAGRYHSLALSALPPELVVTARAESGTVMGVTHRDLSLQGVQFHPESVLTEGGHRLLANWMTQCGDTGAVARAEGLSPLR